MNLLLLFLTRLQTGERWRKTTPDEKRYFAVVFLFIPILFIVLLNLIQFHSRILRLLDSGAVTLWIVFTAGVSATVFGGIALSRHVPAKISMILAVLAWLVLLFLLFGLGFWDFGRSDA